MFKSVQRIAGSSAEFGVQRQYLDGELYLVDDALSGRLHFAPEFKIARAIVQAIAVFVMHGFVASKHAAKFFFHDFALFKYFTAAAQVHNHVPRRMSVPFWVYWAPFATFVPTLFAAKTLFFLVARKPPIFSFGRAVFGSFAAQLALESRWGLLVHLEQLGRAPFAVKGVN